ncbi:MAG: hypothetical protein K2H85_08180, partial [Allobaculum sp.]|nr:hypothetical protein [Allobaculum sp.]
MILATDGLVIRLVFDPTEGTTEIEDVDFFDYDISNGYIYPSEAAAQKAYSNTSPLQPAVIEGDKIYLGTRNSDGSIVKTSTKITDISISSQKLNGAVENYYFPTGTQSETGDPNIFEGGNGILAQQQWYALTYQQGINSNPIPEGTVLYAFGNRNAQTGLGELDWNSTNTVGQPFSARLNMYNNNNALGSTSPNLKGATFNLVAESIEVDDDGKNPLVEWKEGIVAPSVFDIDDTSQPGLTVYSKDRGSTDYFPLEFNRTGGTYVLENVQHYKKHNNGNYVQQNNAATNLSVIESVSSSHLNILSNDFWPMDSAPSYGTDGHDLMFGNNTVYAQENPNQSLALAVGSRTLNSENITGWPLPESDDGINHNSYFGMTAQIPFSMEEGYAAPLNYFFYGDDDLFVFLSRCTRDENGNVATIDSSTTKLVADIGGVHSSIGSYVNLWNFIDSENREVIQTITSEESENGLPEVVYAYKTNRSSDTQSRETAPEVEEVPYDDYVLSVFYTERGASGSSCYMRFSVPFQGLASVGRSQDGEIRIGKEVETAATAQTENEEDSTQYIFELDLLNAN